MSTTDSHAWERLLERLRASGPFPQTMVQKIIGAQSEAFRASVAEFEARFPELKQTQWRQTPDKRHVSLTYEWVAQSAESALEVIRASHQIIDVKVVL